MQTPRINPRVKRAVSPIRVYNCGRPTVEWHRSWDRHRGDTEGRQAGCTAILGGEHPDTAVVYGDRVFPVCRSRAVRGGHGPAVLTDERLDAAQRHHGLDRDDQTRPDPGSAITDPIVED